MQENIERHNTETGIAVRPEVTARGIIINALFGGVCILNVANGIDFVQKEILPGTLFQQPERAALVALGTVASALYLRIVIHNVGRQIEGW